MDDPVYDSIRRNGFRKWYERELLSSHAYMVLAFLSMIAVVGSMEAFRGSADGAAVAALFVVLCAAIGAWAVRRYVFLMMRAEQTANQANCPECGAYGRFTLIGQRLPLREVDVRCQRCARDWVISGEE